MRSKRSRTPFQVWRRKAWPPSMSAVAEDQASAHPLPRFQLPVPPLVKLGVVLLGVVVAPRLRLVDLGIRRRPIVRDQDRQHPAVALPDQVPVGVQVGPDVVQGPFVPAGVVAVAGDVDIDQTNSARRPPAKLVALHRVGRVVCHQRPGRLRVKLRAPRPRAPRPRRSRSAATRGCTSDAHRGACFPRAAPCPRSRGRAP